MTVGGKPTVDELGVDLGSRVWERSGSGDGGMEITTVDALEAQWVLMRVAGDPSDRILVYSRHEWECFLDGAKGGEFDDAVG